MQWPENKSFAFTIIDDTDNSTIENIKPVYDLLFKLGLLTTKTAWVYDSRDKYKGESLQNDEYTHFLLDLQAKGFEIQLHNVGSGFFHRQEILDGLNIFKQKLGKYPNMQINHSNNTDNVYWGAKRYGSLLNSIIKLFKLANVKSDGDNINSQQYWADWVKENIKYIRNRTFNSINTLRIDPEMPYRETNKPLSNYWFSSSDGHTLVEFTNLLTKRNVDKLVAQNGLCIVYTHFASGFADETGKVDPEFETRLKYLASQNGWFVPAGTILDYLLDCKKLKNKREYVTERYINILDIKWMYQRMVKKIKYNR